MATNIIMPEMGEGVNEGTIGNWLKQEGDAVEEFEPIVEIETDKVTTEVVAEAEGVLLQILAQPGDVVTAGTVLGVIGAAEEGPGDGSVPQPQAKAEPAVQVATPASANRNGVRGEGSATADVSYSRQTDVGWVSPVVGRMAAEHDIDLTRVEGTGRGGRITKKDVEMYLQQLAAEPVATTAQTAAQPVAIPAVQRQTTAQPSRSPAPLPASIPGPLPQSGDLIQLTNMRRRIADHMVHSKATSPHVTTFFEFDFSAVAAHRTAHKGEFEKDGAKLTYMPYLAIATVEALKQHPMANASWTDEGILLKREINLGMATAIDEGLVVPVVRGADGMNLLGMARVIGDLAERARTNRLQAAELQGGTFTITNHGASGSLMGTPIINQPQVGILGIGLIEKRVKVINDAIAIRPCAYVSFSFDHRILDGATADAFVMTIKERIEGWK